MLSVIILSVVVLNVVAPLPKPEESFTFFSFLGGGKNSIFDLTRGRVILKRIGSPFYKFEE